MSVAERGDRQFDAVVTLYIGRFPARSMAEAAAAEVQQSDEWQELYRRVKLAYGRQRRFREDDF